MRRLITMAALVCLGGFGCLPGGGGAGGGGEPDGDALTCQMVECAEGEYLRILLIDPDYPGEMYALENARSWSAATGRPESEAPVNDPAYRITGYACALHAEGPQDGWSSLVWLDPADEAGIDGPIIAAYHRDTETGLVEEISCGDGEPAYSTGGPLGGHPETWAMTPGA